MIFSYLPVLTKKLFVYRMIRTFLSAVNKDTIQYDSIAERIAFLYLPIHGFLVTCEHWALHHKVRYVLYDIHNFNNHESELVKSN